eukprot:Colp12_sorted_trinity150504_noHs@1719
MGFTDFVKRITTREPEKKGILVAGLADAGKTTLLYRLDKNVTQTIPTIGMNVEHLDFKNFQMTNLDFGGRDPARPLWRHYFNTCHGIIYVIDRAERELFSRAVSELYRTLSDFDQRTVEVVPIGFIVRSSRGLGLMLVSLYLTDCGYSCSGILQQVRSSRCHAIF